MLKSRRTFLQNAAMTLAALGTGMPCSLTPGTTRPARQPLGFQLYTLGDAVVTDTVAVLARLASFGYAELEAITYANLTPETLRRRVDEAGMKLAQRPPGFLGRTRHGEAVRHGTSAWRERGRQFGALAVGRGKTGRFRRAHRR